MKKIKHFLKKLFWSDLWAAIMTITLIEVLAHSANWYFLESKYAKWHLLVWGILFLITIVIRIVIKPKS